MGRRPGTERTRPEGRDAATRSELRRTVERLRDRNEALSLENARLRRESEAQALHLASFPMLNPDPVLEVDFAGAIRYCNPATLATLKGLGLAVESARPFLPHDFDAVVADLQRGPAGAASREVTLRGRTFLEHLYLARGQQAVRVYAHEVTERARTQRELAAALQRMNAHMDNSPLAVIEFDPQFRVIRWSGQAERMFGWTTDEVLGRSVPEMPWIPESDADAVRAESAAFLCGARSSSVHAWRNLRKDGSIVHCEWHNSAIYDAAGALASVLSLVLDSTGRREAEQALRESKGQLERNLAELALVNAELEAFVYSVSHDLREPLRATSGFAQLVLALQAGRLDARGTDYLRRIERGAGKMNQLIEDLLGLSRISRQRIERTEVDLGGIAAATVAELRERDPGRGVEVHIASGLRAGADRGLVGIVLSNLLANAWKFTAKVAAARIRFGSIAGESETVFFVGDNGAGFDPAYASQLFQPFHRLHAEREYPGSGIGLALVGRIVRLHGGRVWAEGRPGAGATFYFTLGDGR